MLYKIPVQNAPFKVGGGGGRYRVDAWLLSVLILQRCLFYNTEIYMYKTSGPKGFSAIKVEYQCH